MHTMSNHILQECQRRERQVVYRRGRMELAHGEGMCHHRLVAFIAGFENVISAALTALAQVRWQSATLSSSMASPWYETQSS